MRKLILAAAAVAMVVGPVGSVLAGAVGGPKTDRTRVQARDTNRYTVSFRGGETARIDLQGDGDTDLDIFVYDEFGNLVASRTGGTDRESVSWTPRFTGPFTIRVVNLGTVWNEYRIITN